VIAQPIPYTLNAYVTFSDTLTVDDATEAFFMTAPDGTTANVPHGSLVRVVNADTTVTYSTTVLLDQAGLWLGYFSANGANANTVWVTAYVVDPASTIA
jgi:hypothetical protein